jgi:hypothetical protein
MNENMVLGNYSMTTPMGNGIPEYLEPNILMKKI